MRPCQLHIAKTSFSQSQVRSGYRTPPADAAKAHLSRAHTVFQKLSIRVGRWLFRASLWLPGFSISNQELLPLELRVGETRSGNFCESATKAELASFRVVACRRSGPCTWRGFGAGWALRMHMPRHLKYSTRVWPDAAASKYSSIRSDVDIRMHSDLIVRCRWLFPA